MTFFAAVLPLTSSIASATLIQISRDLFADFFSLSSDLVECCFTSTETVGLLRTGAQDSHHDFHTAPELWQFRFVSSCPK